MLYLTCVIALSFNVFRLIPANHIYVLFALDTISFSIISVNKFVYKITPPNVLATISGLTGTLQFNVGEQKKGIQNSIHCMYYLRLKMVISCPRIKRVIHF